jgi:hypothetical protein
MLGLRTKLPVSILVSLTRSSSPATHQPILQLCTQQEHRYPAQPVAPDNQRQLLHLLLRLLCLLRLLLRPLLRRFRELVVGALAICAKIDALAVLSYLATRIAIGLAAIAGRSVRLYQPQRGGVQEDGV